MKKVSALISLAIMFLLLPVVSVKAEKSSLQLPPVAQPLVREGDFALSLANVLKIGEFSDEAQAESMLNAVGVAPNNGWIADYPVTPDILGEIEDSICVAADSGKLAVNKEDAVNALNQVSKDFGLYTSPSPDYADNNSYQDTTVGSYSANSADQIYSSRYTNPTIINNYYYNYGPPVVSYYRPPWDYCYMYTWVSYPFRWYSFWFPGFYVLSDFDRVIIVRGYHRKIISNHVFGYDGRTVFVINPEKRRHGGIHKGRANYVIKPEKKSKGKIYKGRSDIVRGKGFLSQDAKNGASSILKRSYERKTRAMRQVKTERNQGVSTSLSGSGQRKKVLIRQQPSASGLGSTNNLTQISPQRSVIRTEKPSGEISSNKESSNPSHANSVIHREVGGSRSRMKPEVPNKITGSSSDFRFERVSGFASRSR